MRRVVSFVGLSLVLIGCGHREEPRANPNTVPVLVRREAAAEDGGAKLPKSAGERAEPLCKPFSEYVVRKADLNKSVSPCNLYFYADAFLAAHDEKCFRVAIRRGKPIEFSKDDALIDSQDQLRPYWYKWTVLDEKGKKVRSWLAYFLENRDYTYHTIITLPPEEWETSVLEVYFADVDGDGVCEHATYKLMVGDILKARN